ncbi:MAG: hypothetical protein JXD22_08305 [Sedimentisphaerales bacterium]|nr:hypothetical protein [Sedimentisphaerales bacterium]
METENQQAIEIIGKAAHDNNINLSGGRVRRSSSRFCLGVEHGDYNGTELFGVGTDRFIWLAYKPNGTGENRLYSVNFPDDGIVRYKCGQVPEPQSPQFGDSWARFAFGVDYVLSKEGFEITQGIDAVIYGNIPGGGMSRSASLTLNLILTVLEVNGIEVEEQMKIIDLAQAVENVYIGSPCGQLDQIMILFAKEGMGTHYNPQDRSIDYVPLGKGGEDLRIAVMDTGTDRPGLEKSTYKIRKDECDKFAALLGRAGYGVSCLADVRDVETFKKIENEFGKAEPDLFSRCKYIYHAQQRFYQMLEAWKRGDIETVGGIFRADGVGLRDNYRISGPELESMCDIARTVPGVLGERMLGGGDKGAAGALARAEAVEQLSRAVQIGYPRSHPDFANKFATHTCKVVQGITTLEGLI